MRDTEPLDEERQLRANTYALLARLLTSPPDRPLLDALAAAKADASGGETPPLARAWRALAEAASARAPEAVEEEFNALFIGLTRGEVLPYASYYLTGFLMEKPLALLRGDLKRLGFERRPKVHEPEDHAAALLEVMSLLVAAGDGECGRFFNAYLAPWLGRFFEELHDAESARLYRSCAKLGKAFIDVERLCFEMA